MGYEVQLYNPNSGQVIHHQVGGLSTHYIITDQDKIQIDLEETYVQVIIYPTHHDMKAFLHILLHGIEITM